MLRNLGMDILVISTILFGLFDFIPNYIWLIIVVTFILDAISFYFTTQKHGKYFYKRNPDLKKYIDIYVKYVLPNQKNVVWFFVDRYLITILLIVLYIYYFYKNGSCKIF